jgi:hypothetical protein
VVQCIAFSDLCCLCCALQSTSSSPAPDTFKMAFAIWLMCPLPLIVTNALFMKLQPMIAAAHALGWLVKLSLAALAVVLISG